jgi:membrane fusion protein (multidrug efflux system)
MADPTPTAPEAPPRRRIGLYIFLLILVIAGIFGYRWYLYAKTYETTDDAQVDGHLNGVTSRIDGTIVGVHIEENQTIKAGDLIAELDPRDYQVALDQARAELYQAQAQVTAENPNVPITETSNVSTILTGESEVVGAEAAIASSERDYEAEQAKLREAEANAARAQADVARYKPLVEKDEIAREQFDRTVADAKALAARVDTFRASSAAILKTIEQRKAMLAQSHARLVQVRQNAPNQLAISRANISTRQANVRVAQARVARAELDLSYCKIFSPVNGIVTKKSAELGQHVNAGQQLALITQSGDVWVTANFKETQLRHMHPGQRTTVKVDAYDQELEGTVESMPGATGAITSLLPPENATGNYVKVVQRLPVRIRFKKDQAGIDRLRPGMSVVPQVWLN